MTQPLAHPRRPPSSAELICSDGEPMETARHYQQMMLLIESLEYAWQTRSDFYVGGNMFLYFSESQAKNNDFRGPDFFVVLGTTRRERRAWVVWEEDGKAPDVIIELLSDSTEHVDRGKKMTIYGRVLKVGEYFLFDPWSGVLEGYDLDGVRGTYTPKQPDEQGRLRCHQMGLSLGKARTTLWQIEVDWLRWWDPQGNMLPMPQEVAQAEAQRAQAEAQRAQTEAQRAQAEAQRAQAEAQRAERAEAELRALRAKLRG